MPSKSLKPSSNVVDDTYKIMDDQVAPSPMAVGARLRAKAKEKGVDRADLARRSGVLNTTFGGYWNGDRVPPANILFGLADILNADPRELLFGKSGKKANPLQSVDEADWVEVLEYDLRGMTADSRGPVVSSTPIRRDWLNRTFGQANGLWLARLPADLPRDRLQEGDMVILRDLAEGEAQDGAVYIARAFGHLTVVRPDMLQDVSMQSLEQSVQDRRVSFRYIGKGEDKVELIARVLGVPMKRL